jgi:O-antigen/teichoic acid export membrane protein
MGLRESAYRGTRWTTISAVFLVALQLLTLLALVRLLDPEDFGLYGALLIITSFAEIFSDLGASGALIYRRDATREQRSSLYWLNVIVGCSLAGVLVAASPLLAKVTGEPSFTTLIPLAALSLAVVPFGAQFQALLDRDLNFKTSALFEISGAVAGSAVTVGAALAGAGVYALVAGPFANASVRTALLVQNGQRHDPILLRFRTADLRSFLTFGLFRLGSKVVYYFNTRTDQLLVGGLLGLNALGYYNVASRLTRNPMQQGAGILIRVAYPVFAAVKDDVMKSRVAYFSATRMLALGACPTLLGIAATSPTFVPVVLGEQWMPAVPVIHILCLASLVRVFNLLTSPLQLSRGRADISFTWSLSEMLFLIPLLFLGVQLWGLEGAALALLAVEVINQAIRAVVLKRLLGATLLEFLRSLTPALAYSLVMTGAVSLVREAGGSPSLPLLTLEVGTGIAVYGLLVFAFLRRDLREALKALVPHFDAQPRILLREEESPNRNSQPKAQY